MPTNPYVLVVGGAGYIGSHMVLSLKRSGYQPIVLDRKKPLADVPSFVFEIADQESLSDLLKHYSFSAVMHFASLIDVEESVKFPNKYYLNNVSATLNLLDVMMASDVKHFVFSSSAAVYGEPQYTPIDERHPISPINPYGRCKWMVEEIIRDYATAFDMRYAILRYFNAAGADTEANIGERHNPERHLIPLVLEVAAGLRENVLVNGDDYPTADGTCIRDYIHVNDICAAHLLALEKLLEKRANIICNLGSGEGFSVQQVIEKARQITRHPIPTRCGRRRQGDPAILVADANLANQELNWQPRFSQLDIIIKHAWHFISAINKNEIGFEGIIYAT